ncbi:MAG: transposase [Elusimicrobiota bacterium]
MILDDRYFSVLGLSEKTRKFNTYQLYKLLQYRINWRKLFYLLIKAVLINQNTSRWYLILDASPLEQPYAKYRITKRGKISINNMKNVPHNQLISLILSNGTTTVVFDYRIWVSPKVSKSYDYVKQPDLALDLIKKYNLTNTPVKTILIDSFFSSKKIIKWLNEYNYCWFTRIKKSRVFFVNNNRFKLATYDLEINQSIICELKNIRNTVKIIKILHQNEIYFIATNQVHLSLAKIKSCYLFRWKIELFHREAKQKLGLDYIRMENYRSLVNHVGFVCLAFSLLSALRQHNRAKFGNIKRTIQNQLYSKRDGIDRFNQKIAS